MPTVLGLDIGIGSCGWSVVQTPDINLETGEVHADFAILGLGARCFEVPEEPKTRELKNKARRQARGQRKTVRRRAWRLAGVRKALSEAGLPLPGPSPSLGPDPASKARAAQLVWRLRAEGLERLLEPEEFARVLIHLAKHRGFKSNAKRDLGNQDKETGLVKAAIRANRDRLAGRTIGQMMVAEASPDGRKRNRNKDYRFTMARDDIEAEIRALFRAQRRLASPCATAEIEAAYSHYALAQMPLKPSADSIGRCRFEPQEARAYRNCPSFEQFRFLSKLNTVRIVADGKAEPLSQSQRLAAQRVFALTAEISYAGLRRAIALPKDWRFVGLEGEKETKAFAGFQGANGLRSALGPARFDQLLRKSLEILDHVARDLIRLDGISDIEDAIQRLPLIDSDRSVLTDPDLIGRFAGLSGVGHISALAARRLRAPLEAGQVYSEACVTVGYDHSAIGQSRLEDIRNATVLRVLRESLKQIKVVIDRYGMPDFIHLEMARDVGKSPEERQEITKGLDKRQEVKTARIKEMIEKFPDHFRTRKPNGEELLRYELWTEQNHHCLYSGQYIGPNDWLDNDSGVQVDHILPYSRSGDDSYKNKVLTLAAPNQEKRNRTPFEWLGDSPDRWRTFVRGVNLCAGLHKEKRRKLLLQSFADRQDDYRARHLNDTRHAIRALRHELELKYPELLTQSGGERRFFARPGAITALARRSWGLNSLKYGGETEQLGDRDHALDATVVACVTERLLQRMTDAIKQDEEIGRRGRMNLPTPLGASPGARESFRRQVDQACRAVTVSRPENRRARGPLHAETLYGLRKTSEGETAQTSNTHLSKLTPAHLDHLVGDAARVTPMRETLAAWLARANGKPGKLADVGDFPRMPRKGEAPGEGTGPMIRNVKVWRAKQQSGMKIKRGDAEAHVDLESMVRVDVFSKGGKNYLIPIYLYQLSWPEPPMRAIKALKKEKEWDEIDASYEFRFSLYSGSYVEVAERTGVIVSGYYRGCDRSVATINISLPAEYRSDQQLSVSPKTAQSIRKFQVDRFGALHEIIREPRLWPGAAS
jgi:CRISPR-associated endonuclease Csn1